MYIDKENLMCEDQAITVTASSTNVIDLQGAGLGDMSPGEPLKILCQVTEDFTAAGAATLVVDLRTDTVEGMGSPTILLSTQAIGKATLVAGYKLPINVTIPENMERYMDLNFTVATGPMTAGKITAGFAVDQQSNG